MRLMPLITAVLVAVSLFYAVIQRDKLFAIAGIESGPDAPLAELETAAQEAESDEGNLIKVVVARSTSQIVDNAVVLRGRTEAAREVEVRSETSGKVISEPRRKGAFVNAGDLLCELDPGTREASLIEARARLADAEARLPVAEAAVPEAVARRAEAQSRLAEAQARLSEATSRLSEAEMNENVAEQLSAGGFASETRVVNAAASLESARAGITSAQAAVDGANALIISSEAGIGAARAGVESAGAQIVSAQSGVAAAEREMANLRVTAPFSGLLETDAAELGSLLQPGSPCATIIQLDPIKLVGFVPEADVGKVEVGALAGARLASGSEVQGRVTFLSRSSDDSTRTFRVEINVPNADLSIRDGETADILVRADGRSAHLLPQSALTLDDDGRIGVRLLAEGDVTEFAPVTILRDTIDGVFVAGLADSVNVVVIGQEYVVDGIQVAPSYQENSQ